MANIDRLYFNLCTTILNQGFDYNDLSRGGITLAQIPHYQLEIDMHNEKFPLLTTKTINWKSVAHELIWMLSGSTSIQYLVDNNVNIWTEDAKNFSDSYDVGPIYGKQWRFWQPKTDPNGKSDKTPIDQIKVLLTGLKSDLFNRRHIVTAWNPSELHLMALSPCHWAFEILPCYHADTEEVGFILKWHQRSVDAFLGLPFDIASYAFLGKLIEYLIDIPFIKLIGDLSNVHFYHPHIKSVHKQLKRSTDIEGPYFDFEGLVLLENLCLDNFTLLHYNPEPYIKAKLFTKVKIKD